MKHALILFSTIILLSCHRPDEEVQAELRTLKSQNDSLKEELSKYIVRPFMSNLNFKFSASDTFRTSFIAVIDDGIVVDSVEIKELNQTDEMIQLENFDYGTHLTFIPDTIGKFEIKAYTRIRPWGDRVIPVSFPIESKK